MPNDIGQEYRIESSQGFGLCRGFTVHPVARQRTAQLLPQGLENSVDVLAMWQQGTSQNTLTAVGGIRAAQLHIRLLCVGGGLKGDPAQSIGAAGLVLFDCIHQTQGRGSGISIDRKPAHTRIKHQ